MKDYQKKRQGCRKMGKGFYHLCTDGWKNGNIFNNVAQFAYGMTVIGLLTLRFSIIIYDFTLMPNHIHIILSGTGNDAVEAFLYLKRKLNMRLVKDGFQPLPEDYNFKLTPITSEEQMAANILYLGRNHYEKQFATLGGYPWGSSYLNFSMLAMMIDGKRADEYSSRELEQLTGSRTTIPGHWKFHPKLGLLPISFINTRLVKQLFKGPKDYATRYVKDYETFVRIAHDTGEDNSLDNQDVKVIVSTLLESDYQGRSVAKLNNSDKGEMAVKLSRHYGIPVESIAEVLGMSVHLVNQFLRSKDYGK